MNKESNFIPYYHINEGREITVPRYSLYRKLGKQLIRDPARQAYHFRYAKFSFVWAVNRRFSTHTLPHISIPIPYMKKDHGLVIE